MSISCVLVTCSPCATVSLPFILLLHPKLGVSCHFVSSWLRNITCLVPEFCDQLISNYICDKKFFKVEGERRLVIQYSIYSCFIDEEEVQRVGRED